MDQTESSEKSKKMQKTNAVSRFMWGLAAIYEDISLNTVPLSICDNGKAKSDEEKEKGITDPECAKSSRGMHTGIDPTEGGHRCI